MSLPWFCSTTPRQLLVDSERIELSSPRCKRGIIPLYEPPKVLMRPLTIPSAVSVTHRSSPAKASSAVWGCHWSAARHPSGLES